MAWWRRILRRDEKAEAEAEGDEPQVTAPEEEEQEGAPYRRPAAMVMRERPPPRPQRPEILSRMLQYPLLDQPMCLGQSAGEEELLRWLLFDPDEGPLARPFLNGTAGAAELAAYRDYLLGCGDVRGKVLALIGELSNKRPPADAEQKRAELRQLAPNLWRAWLSLVTPYLLNCGTGREIHPTIRFAFQCPRTWEDLAPTSQPSVRHCDGCGEDVHLVETVVDAERLALRGKCISAPRRLVAEGGARAMMTGMAAHPLTTWAHRLFGRVSTKDYERALREHKPQQPPPEE